MSLTFPEYRDHESMPLQVVPQDDYFVLGDHRNSSSDSRSWGFVDRHKIYGKAVLVYWPFDKIGPFTDGAAVATANDKIGPCPNTRWPGPGNGSFTRVFRNRPAVLPVFTVLKSRRICPYPPKFRPTRRRPSCSFSGPRGMLNTGTPRGGPRISGRIGVGRFADFPYEYPSHAG